MPKDGSDLLRAREAIVGVLTFAHAVEDELRLIRRCWAVYGRPRRGEWPDRAPPEAVKPDDGPIVVPEWTERLRYWRGLVRDWRGAVEAARQALAPGAVRAALGEDRARDGRITLRRLGKALGHCGPDGMGVGRVESLAVLPDDWSDDLRVLEALLLELAEPRRTSDAPSPRPRRRRVRKLTGFEIEVFEAVGRCNGNYAEAARLMGRPRQTVRAAYARAMSKVSTASARSVRAVRLGREPSAKRG